MRDAAFFERRGRKPEKGTDLGSVLYEGSLFYKGGHPEHPEPDTYWRPTRVCVTENGITYRRRRGNTWHTVFTIPVAAIRGIDRTQTGGGYLPAENVVIVEMEYNGRPFKVHLQATGFRPEHTASGLYGAAIALLARQPVE